MVDVLDKFSEMVLIRLEFPLGPGLYFVRRCNIQALGTLGLNKWGLFVLS